MNKLKQLQSLDLETKILKSKQRIKEWYDFYGGEVYVSFSGGKDSAILLDLVRSIFKNVKAVFVNTGLEYPEILEFVRTIDNVIELKPKMNFTEVIKKYGYPAISKEQSQFIQQYRNAKSEKTKRTRLEGNKWGRGKISKKWLPFLESDIKVSERCCDIMKKNPAKRFEKETGLHPLIGTMTEESQFRKSNWQKYGCNSFEKARPTSQPLSFWTEKDIWEYIKTRSISYSRIYDMGYKRTGCMFCLYGINLEKGKNRLQLMKKTHPKLYIYILEKLGARKIIEFMNEECSCNIKIDNKGWHQEKLF